MYNGNVPINRANVDGRLFCHIGGSFGRVLYSLDELYAHSAQYACFNFSGFECEHGFKCGQYGYWGRAVVCFNGQTDNDAEFCWRNGCPSSECVLCINHNLYYFLSCIDMTYCAQGNYCGWTYCFPVVSSPSGIKCCSVLYSNCSSAAIPSPAFDGFTLRGPWVEIDVCDYFSGIRHSGLSINCRGVVYSRYINTMYRSTDGNICYKSKDLQYIDRDDEDFYPNVEVC